MEKQILTPLLLLSAFAFYGQENRQNASRQCSAIREIIYTGWHQQFAGITDVELRSSHGFQEPGNWRFANTRYSTTLVWPDAARSFLEHFEQEDDSTTTNTWQYIAETAKIPDILSAGRVLDQLNYQIIGCPYQVSDSIMVKFNPLPTDSLPVFCPDDLQMASLYELPLTDTSSLLIHSIAVMAGIEKTGNFYRVSLIVDDTRVKKKPDN